MPKKTSNSTNTTDNHQEKKATRTSNENDFSFFKNFTLPLLLGFSTLALKQIFPLIKRKFSFLSNDNYKFDSKELKELLETISREMSENSDDE